MKESWDDELQKELAIISSKLRYLVEDVNDNLVPSKNSAMRVFNTRLREALFWANESLNDGVNE